MHHSIPLLLGHPGRKPKAIAFLSIALEILFSILILKLCRRHEKDKMFKLDFFEKEELNK